MTADQALSSIREDIDALEAKQVVKPGHIRRRRAEVAAIERELFTMLDRINTLERAAASHTAMVDRLWDIIHRQLLWMRLYGIPDGTYRAQATDLPGVANGHTTEELQRALNFRLEQYAKQPAPAWSIAPGVRLLPGVAPPWLDGDWPARERAVNAALAYATEYHRANEIHHRKQPRPIERRA